MPIQDKFLYLVFLRKIPTVFLDKINIRTPTVSVSNAEVRRSRVSAHHLFADPLAVDSAVPAADIDPLALDASASSSRRKRKSSDINDCLIQQVDELGEVKRFCKISLSYTVNSVCS